MTRMLETIPTPLAPLVQRFFTERLRCQLGASSNTIASYRDTFRLLLKFTVPQCGKPPTDMDISDISADLVGDFLNHLETERCNSVQSRNVRLFAIRSFFHFVAVNEPQLLHHCQKVLQLPAKRHQKTEMTWLSDDEITALLGAPDLTTWYGRRDQALLMLGVQTGLRVSELIGLKVKDVHLGSGPHMRCLGKGRKDRATPLRVDAVKVLETWIAELGTARERPLFPSNRGGPLSRDAVEHIVAKHGRSASANCPTLREKRITPHCLRHSAAMTLLDEGVSRTVIALWLGHESAETTQVYLHADLRMKQKAMGKTRPVGIEPGRFRPADNLLAFLEAQ